MEDSVEDGELEMEDGEVAPSPTSQRLLVPPAPMLPEYDDVLAQRKPKKVKASKTAQSGYHDVYGQQARAEVQIYSYGAIRTLDVQGLVLWILAEGMNPKWCFVKNKALVSKVVMIGMPGLDAQLFNAKKEVMPIMHSQLAAPAVVQAKNAQVPTGSTLATLFTVPLSKKRKRDNELQQHAQGRDRHGQNGREKAFPPSHYAATLEQMEANDYPLPLVHEDGSMTCPPAFVATQPAGDKAPIEMVSVDCEMCVTSAGFELTRASLVDGKGRVLLDELVLPDNPITDYNTQFSGITPQAMAGVTTTLTDIQKRLCKYVSAETLLVGHALENDLKALKIIHANCLDTVFMFPHPKGPPAKPALRFLAERHLKRIIQSGEHDSVIDARAALDLAKLKIAKGPAYGLANHAEQGDKLMDVLHTHKRRCTLIDKTDMLNRHVTAGASAIVIDKDEEAIQKACKEIGNPSTDFVWTQLRGLGNFLGTRAATLKQQHAQELQQRRQQEQSQDQHNRHDLQHTPHERSHRQQQFSNQQQQQQIHSPQHGPDSSAIQSDKGAAEIAGDQNTTQPAHSNGISGKEPAGQHKEQSIGQHDLKDAVDTAMDDARRTAQANGNAPDDDQNASQPVAAKEFAGQQEPSSSEQRSSEEQAASTTETHTEEHKVVKTDQDAQGNQKAKAEVVQKQVSTKVKKRKRVEQASAGSNGSAAESGAAPSGAEQINSQSNAESNSGMPPGEDSTPKQGQQDQNSKAVPDQLDRGADAQNCPGMTDPASAPQPLSDPHQASTPTPTPNPQAATPQAPTTDTQADNMPAPNQPSATPQASAPDAQTDQAPAPTPQAATPQAALTNAQTDKAQTTQPDVSDAQLNRVLQGLDSHIGKVLEALPANGMLILFTCQGDTAELRRMQEQKYRRQQKLDNLPPWTLTNEADFAKAASRACQALCFASVKQ